MKKREKEAMGVEGFYMFSDGSLLCLALYCILFYFSVQLNVPQGKNERVATAGKQQKNKE